MQPVFHTPRLHVRPRVLPDTDACIAMDRDPEVIRFVNGPWSDPVAHRAFIEARTARPYATGLGYWSITPRDDVGTFLGWVLLIPVDGVGPEIEIGWRLRRSAWGAGYATEASRPVLRHALDTLQLPCVVADIHPDNYASQRVAEKLGLTATGPVMHGSTPAVRYVTRAAE